MTPKYEPERGNAYKRAGYTLLPNTIDKAIEMARASEFMKRVMGEDTLAILVQQAEREREFVNAQVTPVEQARYLGNL